MDTPRRPETGRPRAAQFAPRAVYIQDGNATGCGKKVTLVEPAGSGLIGPAPTGGGGAVGELTEPERREARYEQAEAISLAFVTALQVLPPRQVAVLILRDVLGYRASEVAGMLDSTVESVTSALKRARASLQHRLPPAAGHQPPPALGSPAEEAIVAKFVRAWESADLDALAALLAEARFSSMPPMPFEYQGRDVA